MFKTFLQSVHSSYNKLNMSTLLHLGEVGSAGVGILLGVCVVGFTIVTGTVEVVWGFTVVEVHDRVTALVVVGM